ncbi:MAG: prephenate dehydrogenase/arogenate dehydrogenase family protein [Chloroflexi bacterium]|jgi:prephenate dehydrogenase|nr:prephenate dehydrogenase/arogenate dehydrogenase family protein [Chloroflexota bacterium]
MIEKSVCIVGLGLMGGSLVRALKGQVKWLIGVDRHASTRQLALSDGVVDTVTDDLSSGVSGADLIILATPVQTILQILRDLPQLRPDGCMVMDMGSTKEEICEAMAALPGSFAAIGGHPMCGKETAGYHASDADLFREQTFILSRNGRTTHQIEELSLSIIEHVGAHSMFLSADEHDQIVAVASHLPYVISATLMHRASEMGDDRVWSVSASGFRDTSRLAGSDPRMMLEILLTNRKAILSQLNQYNQELAEVSELLEGGNKAALAAWLAEAQQQHSVYHRQKMDSS